MPFSTEQLKEKLATQIWTSCNVRLNDEVCTYPEWREFLLHHDRLKSLYRTLLILFPSGLSHLRIADLGSMEGGFSLALALKGADVVGVEARAQEIEKANLLKEHFEINNLIFIQGDVKDFNRESFGKFDLVLAFGILYHLDNPIQVINQISGTTNRLILDTHYAPSTDDELFQIKPELSNLGPIECITHDNHTYQGRWFFEYPEDADRESQTWASYSNNKSFWLTKESLLLALNHAGFDTVFEQHDWTMDRYDYFLHQHSRAMFVALKSPTAK